MMLIKSLKHKVYRKKLQGKKVPQIFRRSFDRANHLDTKKPIKEASFVVIDTETTGFKPEKGDSLLSVAGIGFVNGRVDLSRSFYELIKPQGDIPPESVMIHNLTPEKFASHPVMALPDVLTGLFEFCDGDILVGHHVSFDVRFLNHALKAQYGITMHNRVVDTAVLATALKEIDDPVKMSVQECQQTGLDDIARQFSISMPDRHDAYGDAFATALIFQRQIGILQKEGITTLKALFRLAGLR